jgi:preprotein translocase subunit SecE
VARNRQRAKQRKARQQAQAARQAYDASVAATDADGSGEAAADDAVEQAKPKVAKAQAKPAPAKAKSEPKPLKKADQAPRERGRVSGFFRSVWAELKRVQWPSQRQVATLTGVVIAFVLIAGAYLGLIDAIAKQVVDVTIF